MTTDFQISPSTLPTPSGNDFMTEPSPTAWWQEREAGWLLLLVLFTYFLRVTALPIYGEEPRRGLIAREMTENGDWVVPRTQGILRPSRPPLQNWMIIGASRLTGAFDEWAIRLPSLLCTLATVLLIYAYARNTLSRLGALSAAACYATMAQVLEYGRLGETEAVFTLFVAGSLLLWHWGWSRGWPVWMTWTVGYAFASLGLLTKGVQAPIYFAGTIGLYLLATRRWRDLFTIGHLVGLLAGPVLFVLWQGLFLWRMGLENTWTIYFWNVAGRFHDRDPSRAVLHVLTYPFEVFGVAMLPWSLLLIPFASRRFRESLGEQRGTARFLAIAVAWAFVFVWLPPGSRTRYYMPLYPCYAVLMGMTVERLAAMVTDSAPQRWWAVTLRSVAAVMAVGVVVLTVITVAAPDSRLALPAVQLLVYGASSVALAVLCYRAVDSRSSSRRVGLGLMSVVLFLSITAVGPAMTIQSRRCNDIAESVATLRQQLPDDVRLVSLNATQHAFAFHYGRPIPVVAWPTADAPLPDDLDYFCVRLNKGRTFRPAFAWQEVATVICDRLHQDVVDDRVIIGRRLPKPESLTATQASEPQSNMR